MKTLNTLHGEAMALAAEAFDVEGDEAIDDWWARVDAWADASGEKLLAYRIVRERLLAEREYLDGQAAQVSAAAKRRGSQIDDIDERVKAFLIAHHELTGQPKVTLSDGGWARLQTHRTVAVEVDDVAELPAELTRVRVDPDKRAIKEELQAGREIPGARLLERESLSVRWPNRARR